MKLQQVVLCAWIILIGTFMFAWPATMCGATLDEVWIASLEKHHVKPAPVCSDDVFLRRVTLDTIGTIPTPRDVREFLADTSPDRRAQLVERLLDSEAFVDYCTLRWCDTLRVKAEFPINLWPHGAATYHRWVQAAMRERMPYDVFARTLLTASGSNFRNGAANFYRAVQAKDAETLAEIVALTWLGQRTGRWSDADRAHLATFFSRVAFKETAEWKEEIVYWRRVPLENADVVFPDGTRGRVAPNEDPRAVLAHWLTAPQNKQFREAAANRVWFWLFGRGLVDEADDFRSDNPPVHPDVLTFLGEELASHKFDLRHLYRLLLNSRVYQQAAVHPTLPIHEAEPLFVVYPVRRLEAEVLQDILIQIFDVAVSYSSEVPEPFTFIPPRYRTITLADASVTSAFLEMFGRPSRDTGLTTDRDGETTEAQMLFLMNSTEVNLWIGRLARSYRNMTPVQMLDEVWLALLSRYPTDAERRDLAAVSRRESSRTPQQRLEDIIWAVLNSSEFLCHH